MTNTHPNRCFFRYSLRSLMLAVTVFCIWMGITAKRARDQREAVSILERDGSVFYEHQLPRNSPSNPPGPEWFRQLIGDDYFFIVHSVVLRGPAIKNRRLAAIKRLTDVKNLALRIDQVTDSDLANLKGQINLESLSLNGKWITDAGLEHLHELANLRTLELGTTRISDEAVEKLRQALPNCTISYVTKDRPGMTFHPKLSSPTPQQ